MNERLHGEQKWMNELIAYINNCRLLNSISNQDVLISLNDHGESKGNILIHDIKCWLTLMNLIYFDDDWH